MGTVWCGLGSTWNQQQTGRGSALVVPSHCTAFSFQRWVCRSCLTARARCRSQISHGRGSCAFSRISCRTLFATILWNTNSVVVVVRQEATAATADRRAWKTWGWNAEQCAQPADAGDSGAQHGKHGDGTWKPGGAHGGCPVGEWEHVSSLFMPSGSRLQSPEPRGDECSTATVSWVIIKDDGEV
jgi:hypothetical protein